MTYRWREMWLVSPALGAKRRRFWFLITTGHRINQVRMTASGEAISCAWHYKQYQNEQSLEDRLSYAKAEDNSRALMVGLWADIRPELLWDWRKTSRK